MDQEESKPHISLRGWWVALSIRYKVGFFLGMVITTVLILCVLSLGMTALLMRDVNDILGDSYAVSHALSCFETENNAFTTYSGSRSAEDAAQHHATRAETAGAVANLQLDYGKVGKDRYLLTQAIQNAYGVYGENCDRLLEMSPGDSDYIRRYYENLDIAAYINTYLKELMQYTLAEGTTSYARKMRVLQILPLAGISVSVLIILFAALFGTITVRHIILPVLQLAKDARKISENQLDFPDQEVPNRDEIGQLVETFNKMKHSMRGHIQSLQEFNQIESRLHQEELQRVAMEQELRGMQLSMLQSQINPHFLFNTLNTIRSTSKIEGAANTEELIQRLANLFRYNLQTADQQVPLERELTIVKDYMFIQKRRFGHRLGFEANCRPDLETATVPTFTLQPLVENAVIHGISPREEGGRVRVRIRGNGGRIIIWVTDNGRGIDRDRLALLMQSETSQKGHMSHIGMGNVRSRLTMLYPESEFRIWSRVGMGTVIRLTIPVTNGGEELIDV